MEQEYYYFIRVEYAKSYAKKWQKELASFAARYNGTTITRSEVPKLVSILRDAVKNCRNVGEINGPRWDARFDTPNVTKFISAEDYTIVLVPVFGWWNGGKICR